MRHRTFFLALLLTGIAACSGDNSLQGAFEKQMHDDEVDGFTIIHLEENESDGLVLFTSWTKDYPENRNKPSIHYFQKTENHWKIQTGTACSTNGIAQLGLMGNGYLYCAGFKKAMSFEAVRVGDKEAKLFSTPEVGTVWYARAGEREMKVIGITAEGREIALN